MKKEKLRFLALGFFLSGLILTIFQLSGFNEKTIQSDSLVKVESVKESEKPTNKVESNKKNESAASSESVASSESKTSKPESSESSESESKPTESKPNDKMVFVVQEGQPSSVVAEYLHASGLIDDVEAFQKVLEERGLSNSVQYGSYELSKDMSYNEIIDIITIQ